MTPYANPSFGSLFIEALLDGKPIFTATCFIVNSPSRSLLVTNKHVVTGTNTFTHVNSGMPDALRIHHHREGEVGERIAYEEPIYLDGKPLWYEHPNLNGEADFVVLPLTHLEGVALFPYDPTQRCFQEIPTEVFGDVALEPTDSVSIVGYPFGKSSSKGLPIWVNGFLATGTDDSYKDLPVILVDSRTRDGQSGSPVIAFRPAGAPIRGEGSLSIGSGDFGVLLGIYSGRIDRESDIGIVWKSSALVELIQSLV